LAKSAVLTITTSGKEVRCGNGLAAAGAALFSGVLAAMACPPRNMKLKITAYSQLACFIRHTPPFLNSDRFGAHLLVVQRNNIAGEAIFTRIPDLQQNACQ
jgi:hypothetical protein